MTARVLTASFSAAALLLLVASSAASEGTSNAKQALVSPDAGATVCGPPLKVDTEVSKLHIGVAAGAFAAAGRPNAPRSLLAHSSGGWYVAGVVGIDERASGSAGAYLTIGYSRLVVAPPSSSGDAVSVRSSPYFVDIGGNFRFLDRRIEPAPIPKLRLILEATGAVTFASIYRDRTREVGTPEAKLIIRDLPEQFGAILGMRLGADFWCIDDGTAKANGAKERPVGCVTLSIQPSVRLLEQEAFFALPVGLAFVY